MHIKIRKIDKNYSCRLGANNVRERFFDIKKNISGEWKLNISEEDLGKKMFCL